MMSQSDTISTIAYNCNSMLWLPCFVLPVLVVSFPVPPEQTKDQIERFEQIRSKAKGASEAATPAVLAFFDSSDFRSALRECGSRCSAVARLPSEELLRRYRAEAQVAELAHALPAVSSRIFHDVDLKELGKMQWFPNEFQMALIHHFNISNGSSLVNDLSQTGIFGCKPFAGSKPTWSEASNRLIYTAHNMRRLDTGSKPLFGDITVVFNSSRVKDMVVIAPHDTGLFTMVCFHPEVRPAKLNLSNTGRHLNCSAWPKGLPMGTLEYLDHLILPNLAAGANSTATNRTRLDAVRDLYTRSGMSDVDYETVPVIDDAVMSEYLEADIFANPQLPEAVKFVIGSFPTLFGTEAGLELQAAAKRLNWPLFWAFGDGDPGTKRPGVHSSKRYKSNKRIADPSGVSMTNASITSAGAVSFQKIWQEAADLRRLRNATAPDVQSWWRLLAHQLHVGPVTATSCAALQDCVAVDLTSRDCICVTQRSQLVTI